VVSGNTAALPVTISTTTILITNIFDARHLSSTPEPKQPQRIDSRRRPTPATTSAKQPVGIGGRPLGI
jgi:hypothetical protein